METIDPNVLLYYISRIDRILSMLLVRIELVTWQNKPYIPEPRTFRLSAGKPLHLVGIGIKKAAHTNRR